MDRSILKANAKKVMSKNHMMCVVVAFLSMLSGAGFSGGNFSINLNTSDPQAFPDNFFGGATSDESLFGFFITAALFIVAMVATIAIGYVLNAFVFNQLRIGGTRYFLKMRKNNPVDINELVQSYKDKTYLNVAKTVITRDVSILLWSFVFVIPGIIKGYEYAAVDYILSVRPDIDRKEALALSSKIMDGHKFDFFVLELSFLGWELLSIFTCMLLSIFYVNPYKMITHIEFFSAVRDEAIANGIITPNDIPDYCEFVPEAPVMTYGAQTEMPISSVNTQPDNTAENTQADTVNVIDAEHTIVNDEIEPFEVTEPTQSIEPVEAKATDTEESPAITEAEDNED